MDRRPLTRRALTGATIAVIAIAALSGCDLLPGPGAGDPSSTDPSPEPTPTAPLEEGTTEVQLAVGESAQISLGSLNPSTGDQWGLISQTDETVADAWIVSGEAVYGPHTPNPRPTGTPSPHAIEITALAPGTTTLRFLYCTRTAIAEGCDQSNGTLDPPVPPQEITVTVR